MKQLKKPLIFSLAIATLVLTSFVSAESVVGKTHSSLYSDSQCDGGVFHQVMYAGSSRHEMVDKFTETNTSYVWQINTPNTWWSLYNVIPNALSMPTLDYFSNGKPHDVNTIVVMGSKAGAIVGTTLPASYKRSDIAAQVVYHVERTRWIYKPGTMNTMQYLDYNNLGAGTQTYKYNAAFPKATYSDNECMQVHIGFCGDGILDNSTTNSSNNINARLNGGEECDPKDPNKVGRGTAEVGCDTSCKPVNKILVPPVCNPSYHNTTEYNTNFPTPRLNTTMDLCKPGTVEGFVFNATTGKYTWGCKNDGQTIANDACVAQDLRCGDGVKNGPEQCDPKDPNKVGRGTAEVGCDASCKPVNKIVVPPVCNSDYDKKTGYNPNYPSPRLNSSMPLCNPGEVVSLQGPDTKGKYSWGCRNDGQTTVGDACTAQDLRCGDGVKNGPEQCDPKDPNKVGRGTAEVGCDASCKPVNKIVVPPVCNSDYDKKTGYNPNFPTSRLNSSMPLCNPGEVVSLQGPDTKGKYSWGCRNDGQTTVGDACTAQDLRCGDGVKNGPEQCDPKDPNKVGWGTAEVGCDASCKPVNKIVVPPVCNSDYDKKTAYNPNFPTSRLNSSMPLCNPGEAVSLQGPDTKGKYSWGCRNDGQTTVGDACTAQDLRCGDGVKNGPEQCDPKDPNKVGWGTAEVGCDASCKPVNKIVVPPVCNSDYDGQVFYNRNYPTPYLNKDLQLCNPGNVGDFNGPNYTNPTTKGFYSWACNGASGTTPAECQARELRCGDGKIQAEYGEECDPEHPDYWGKKTCTNDCKIVEIPPHPEIDKKRLGKETYAVGEEIGFKMVFKNTSSTTSQRVIIRDSLPKNLEYISSQIFGVEPSHFGVYKKAGLDVVEYSGFNLNPGQEGYLILTGKALSSYTSETINTICIYDNTKLTAWNCDTDSYKLETPEVSIKKDVNKTYVQSGDIVDFSIIVKAEAGSYSDLVVFDQLPKGLEYVQNSQVLIQKTTDVEIVSFTAQERLEWKLKFPKGFKRGDYFTLKIKAKVMETDQRVYTNIACVDVPERPCDSEDVLTLTDLRIKKYVNRVLDDTGRNDDHMQFEKGATGYFILEVFGASNPLTEFRVEDTIEGNLKYLDSMDLANNAFTGTISFKDGRNVNYTINPRVTVLSAGATKIIWEVKMLNGGYFLPGDTLKIKFKAQVNGEQNNIAYVYYPKGDGTEGYREDPAKVMVLLKPTDLNIKKYVDSDLTDSGMQDDSLKFTKRSTAYFTLKISGATNPLTGFKVEDVVEGNLKYLDSMDLANNAFTGKIVFSGSRNPAYTITPRVTEGAGSTKIVWEIKMLDDAFLPGDILTIKFKAQVNGNQKNVAHVYYPKGDGTEGHKQDPASVAVGGGSSGGWSGGGGGSTPDCGDGKRNGMEICDWGGVSTVIPSDGKLFRDFDRKDARYVGWTCTSSCTLEKQGEGLPACFNTQNGSPSIMKGEVLPFYFNLEGMMGADASDADYQNYLQESFFLSKDGDSCEAGDVNKIDLRSMECTFTVYGPGERNTNAVYTFTAPCMSLDGWSDSNRKIYQRIESFVKQNKTGRFGGSFLSDDGEVKNVFKSLDDNRVNYPTLLPVSSKLLITDFGESSMRANKAESSSSVNKINTFGEYKLSLMHIQFKYCAPTTDKDGKETFKITDYKNGYERVCEVDFAVTNPYLIQKSPYGIGNNKATINLNTYKLKNGTTFMSAFPSLKTSAEDYQVPKEIANTFATFKNKYSKVAKKVTGELSKVPGKSIYLLDGQGQIDLVKILGDATAKPFTLIAKNKQDILIKGNLNSNAMIMTEGQIIIDASSSCNGVAGKNATEGQRIQGIFYAGAGFKSVGHDSLKNTKENLRDGAWCNYGNLLIRGVAMGDLSDLVAKRRSELYTWFEGTGGGASGEEKVEKVLNGGSVVLEYYPDLRGNLPPGAEEFNKALEVYRK